MVLGAQMGHFGGSEPKMNAKIEFSGINLGVNSITLKLIFRGFGGNFDGKEPPCEGWGQ